MTEHAMLAGGAVSWAGGGALEADASASHARSAAAGCGCAPAQQGAPQGARHRESWRRVALSRRL